MWCCTGHMSMQLALEAAVGVLNKHLERKNVLTLCICWGLSQWGLSLGPQGFPRVGAHHILCMHQAAMCVHETMDRLHVPTICKASPHQHIPLFFQGGPRLIWCAGALLYDARELFDAADARADEGLRSIVQALPDAVATCVDAAAAELDEARQAALIKVWFPDPQDLASATRCIGMISMARHAVQGNWIGRPTPFAHASFRRCCTRQGSCATVFAALWTRLHSLTVHYVSIVPRTVESSGSGLISNTTVSCMVAVWPAGLTIGTSRRLTVPGSLWAKALMPSCCEQHWQFSGS